MTDGRRANILDVPLGDGFMAQLVLPRDLTGEEARRLGMLLLTLAVDISPAQIAKILITDAEL